MLMWEVSSGHPPYINYEHNYDLAMKIVNGMRPKIVPGTPLEYRKLMEQCWDANLIDRPDILMLRNKIRELLKLYLQNENKGQVTSIQKPSISDVNNSIDSISKIYTSKIYQFENFPEPRNATEGMII